MKGQPQTEPGRGNPQPIVIRQETGRRWLTRVLMLALLLSLLFNFVLYSQYEQYYQIGTGPLEQFRSGDESASAKIAVIEVNGTIMPPFTERVLKAIKKAQEDDDVKGVLLAVDSPGGLVADSHQIFHELVKLREDKPIAVAMKRLAASGGYYVSMGAGAQGKIFAEPTTWTGSIGVIIPHFDAHQLADKVGVQSEPLKTGPFKDALSPFRELSDEEREVWRTIMNEAFDQFLTVISENRQQLDRQSVEQLATGQVYTASQAKANGLIDEIGFEEDAIDALKEQLGLSKVRVVTYAYQPGLLELLTGSVEAQQPAAQWRALLESTVPQALYLCSWAPGIPLR